MSEKALINAKILSGCLTMTLIKLWETLKSRKIGIQDSSKNFIKSQTQKSAHDSQTNYCFFKRSRFLRTLNKFTLPLNFLTNFLVRI